ncbi:other/FunK1 protein kinase [Coprinopsis cinerea AmutBmut pab1-1]|nr:other/FunK1 protein kinase [Coprinopsis cinerea AmutBmut pab1-1]
MASDPFPNELLDAVIDDLDPKTDAQTLSSLALVNQHATTIVNERRFKNVALIRSLGGRRCEGLWELVKANPNLVHNILSLQLADNSIDGGGFFFGVSDESSDEDDGDEWTSTGRVGWLGERRPVAPGLVELLTAVKPTLQVLAVCSRLQWRSLSRPVRRALLELASSPALKVLKLGRFIQIPISLFLTSPHLKQLSSKRTYISPSNSRTSNEPSQVLADELGQLDVLELRDSFSELQFLPLSLSKLRRLVVEFSPEENMFTQRMPHDVKDALWNLLEDLPLKEFRLLFVLPSHFSAQLSALTQFILFTKWPLRVLEVAVIYRDNLDAWMGPLSLVLAKMKTLEELRLEVYPISEARSDAYDRRGATDIECRPAWESLEKALVQLSTLRKLVIVFDERHRETEMYRDPEDTLKAAMPTLLGDGRSLRFAVEWNERPEVYYDPECE